MNKTAIETLANSIHTTANLLAALKEDYAERRLEALRTVTTTKVGETITLAAGKRILKAKKNAYGRFTVKEAGKIIVKEYMGGGIHDLRFDIAMGKI